MTIKGKAALLVATMFTAVPALAQTADNETQTVDGTATAQENQPTPDVDEIVVTARKKTERLLDVPISVSAFSSERIDDKLAESITDIADFTPGLQSQEAFGRGNDRPVIRGASNIRATEGKVGIFLDGVPFFGDYSSLDLANVERVEVIKGPQAAIFGRGTLSGAINVVLKRPSDHLTGRISGTVGSYGRTEASAFISAPLTSWLGFDAGVKYYDIEGQYKNSIIYGQDLGAQNSRQYTASIYLDPTPNISASIRWLHQTDDDGPYAVALQPSTEDNCFLSTRPYYCGVVQRPDTFALNNDELQRPGLYRNADRVLGDFEWDIGGSGYNFTFQAGYSKIDKVLGNDQSYDGREFYLLGSPFVCQMFVPIGNQLCTQSGFNTTFGSRRDTQTYEARISSPDSNRLSWRLGVFTSYDTTDPWKKYVEASELGLDILSDTDKVRNRSVFGGVDFDVTDTVTIGGELRYSNDRVRSIGNTYRAGDLFSSDYLSQLTRPDPDQIIGTPGTRETTFDAVLPRATANWRAAPGLNLYGQFAIGNSPGGFNPPGAPQSTYDEERLYNYEVGVKTNRFGFDYLNLALFWENYKNQVLTNTYQTPQRIDTYKVNIGRTRIRGLELEGAYPLLGDALRVQFNYTYLDAEIRRGITPDKAILLKGMDCKTNGDTNLDLPGCREAASVAGNRPPLVSEHTGSVGVRSEVGVSPGWSAFGGGDLIVRGSFFAQTINQAETGTATKVNLQFGFRNEDGFQIRFWGKNVFGDDTPVGVLRYVDLGPGVAPSPSGDSPRAFAITPARKTEIGATASFSF